MIDIGLGLGASLAWGSSDFAAAVASRRGDPSRIALLSQVVALPPLLAVAVLTGAHFPAPLVVLAAAAGLLDAVGITALYSALAVGSISVIAPMAALGGLIPMVIDAVSGQRPGPLSLAAAIAAVTGAALAARERGGFSTRGLARAAVASVAFGGFFFLLAAAARGGGDLPAATVAKASTLGATLLAVGLSRRRTVPARTPVVPVLAAGLLDGLGALAYASGAGAFHAGLVAAAASTCPATTVVLATLVLRERPRRAQLAGIATALAAAVVLAATT
jgi:drug/metabolite transporter (DMT)-like permease